MFALLSHHLLPWSLEGWVLGNIGKYQLLQINQELMTWLESYLISSKPTCSFLYSDHCTTEEQTQCQQLVFGFVLFCFNSLLGEKIIPIYCMQFFPTEVSGSWGATQWQSLLNQQKEMQANRRNTGEKKMLEQRKTYKKDERTRIQSIRESLLHKYGKRTRYRGIKSRLNYHTAVVLLPDQH